MLCKLCNIKYMQRVINLQNIAKKTKNEMIGYKQRKVDYIAKHK